MEAPFSVAAKPGPDPMFPLVTSLSAQYAAEQAGKLKQIGAGDLQRASPESFVTGPRQLWLSAGALIAVLCLQIPSV